MRMMSIVMAVALTLTLMLGASTGVVRAVWPGLEDIEARDEIASCWDEFGAVGIDLRELWVDVIGNHVVVGASGSLPPVREALAEYGDKVRVDGKRGYWKAALVNPLSGEVAEIIDGPVGKSCQVGPWPAS